MTPIEALNCLNRLKGLSSNQPSSVEMMKKQNTPPGEDALIFEGILKYFDEKKNYGFIVMDYDNTEIFFHTEDIIV